MYNLVGNNNPTVVIWRFNMAAPIGESAPNFSLATQSGDLVSLSQFKGNKSVVLSFHVFDFTGG